MRRGEVYFVDFGKDKTTHKQCGIRPAVIVSNNRGNGHGPTVTVVPLTGADTAFKLYWTEKTEHGIG